MILTFDPALEGVLREAGAAAARLGARAWGVGGVVRDAILDHPNKDVDVTVTGDAPAVASELARVWGAELEVHPVFSTATLRRADGFLVDVVRARSETYPAPGALPVVAPDGLNADLARRDFSVNAMAVSLNTGDFGALVDPLAGLADLRERRLRILHAGSFRDDPTRLFRAARYAVRYGLTPDDGTEAAASAAVAAGALGAVSSDRVRREVERLCEERLWADMLPWLNRWGVWAALGGTDAVAATLRRADAVLAWAARSVSEPVPDIATFRRLTFLAFQPESLWPRMSVPPPEAARIARARSLADVPETPEGWRVLDARDMTELLLALCLARTDAEKRRLTRYITEIRAVRLTITGTDLLAAGARPGPGLGAALRSTLDALRLGRLHGTDAEREHALRVWKEENARAAGGT